MFISTFLLPFWIHHRSRLYNELTRFEVLSTQYAVPFSFPFELPFAMELCKTPSFVDIKAELDPEPEPDPEPALALADEIPGPRVTELDDGIGRISPGITICV